MEVVTELAADGLEFVHTPTSPCKGVGVACITVRVYIRA